jgi:hypothetical protein
MRNSVFICLIFFASCAQPKYENPIGVGGTNQDQTASCSIRFQKSGNCLSWKWKDVSDDRNRSIDFKVSRQNLVDGTPVELDIQEPFVKLFMPSMGHGSSPASIVSRGDVGTYSVSQLNFLMPGEWDIIIESKAGNVVLDYAVISITIQQRF